MDFYLLKNVPFTCVFCVAKRAVAVAAAAMQYKVPYHLCTDVM
jgi:hypothetical protein